MSIKYCYKEEIHKSFVIPPTFNALIQDIKTIFEDAVPENFSIQYIDGEDDLVTISSDLEYRSMLRFDIPRPKESIKLYIVPSPRRSTERIESKIIVVSNKDSEGSFEVIETEKSNTDGGISEFTLTSDEERNNRSRRFQSSDSRESRKTDVSLERASTSSPKNDSSDGQEKDTLDNLYEIRALLLKECFAKSPRIVAHKVELPVHVKEVENRPRGGFKDESNSRHSLFVFQKRRDVFRRQQTSAAKIIQRAFRRLKDLKNEGKKEFEIKTLQRAFNRLQSFRDCMLEPNVSQESDLNCSYASQNSASEILYAQAVFIQKNFRGYRTRKILKMFAERPSSAADDEELLEIWSANEASFFTRERPSFTTDYNKAAVTIQKAFRGFALRKRLALYAQESFNFEEPVRGYRLQRMLRKFMSDFEQKTHQRNEDLRRSDEQEDDSWRWAQERVQAQNERFDEDLAYEDCGVEDNYRTYSYQPMNLRSNDSFDSPLKWNTAEIRPKEVNEGLYQSSARDNSFRCDAHDSYEHHRQNEDAPFRSWLNVQNRYFDSRAGSSPTPISVESPYTIEIDCAHSRLRRPQQRSPQDYKYRLMQGTSPNVMFYGPNNGRMIVYKTIYIENTGNKPWNRCFVRSIGAISGKTAEISSVDVGQIVMVTLELSGYFDYGHHNTHWKLVHENEHGMVESIGEPLNVEFVIEPKQIMANRSRECDQTFQRHQSFITERDDEEEEDGAEEEEGEGSFREMSREGSHCRQDDAEMSYDTPSFFEQDNIQDFERFINYKTQAVKVGEIRTIFPHDSLDEILAFVNQRPNTTTDEVVLAYLKMRNEC